MDHATKVALLATVLFAFVITLVVVHQQVQARRLQRQEAEKAARLQVATAAATKASNERRNRMRRLVLSVAGAVAGVYGTPLVINALGFTATGIARGSVAARVMGAASGLIRTGSWFSTLQTIGANGFSTVSKGLLYVVGSISGVVVNSFWQQLEDEQSE